MAHHSCTGGECSADGGHREETAGAGDKWLQPSVDLANVTCLNESSDGAGKRVVKPVDKRSTCIPYVESCDDAELVIHVPFMEGVRIRSVIVGTGAHDEFAPTRAQLFVDRDDITCGDHGIKPTQVVDLVPDNLSVLEYPLNASKFSNPTSVTLHLIGTGDKIRVSCIGFKGETTGVKRGVVVTVYEAVPSAKDHKVGESSTDVISSASQLS